MSQQNVDIVIISNNGPNKSIDPETDAGKYEFERLETLYQGLPVLHRNNLPEEAFKAFKGDSDSRQRLVDLSKKVEQNLENAEGIALARNEQTQGSGPLHK